MHVLRRVIFLVTSECRLNMVGAADLVPSGAKVYNHDVYFHSWYQVVLKGAPKIVIMSWHGNAFRITGVLWEKPPVISKFPCGAFVFLGISLNKLLNTLDGYVIWDLITLIWRHFNVRRVNVHSRIGHDHCSVPVMRYAARWPLSLLWRHNGRDGFWNHQPHDCLLNRSFRRR